MGDLPSYVFQYVLQQYPLRVQPGATDVSSSCNNMFILSIAYVRIGCRSSDEMKYYIFSNTLQFSAHMNTIILSYLSPPPLGCRSRDEMKYYIFPNTSQFSAHMNTIILSHLSPPPPPFLCYNQQQSEGSSLRVSL